MKIQIHSLVWKNTDPRFLEHHKKIFEKFDLPINYTIENYNHGQWMTHVAQNEDYDYILFCDIDCVPITRDVFDEALRYCMTTGGFIGPAQASNHYPPPVCHHIFSAPSFFMISKETYRSMNNPSFESVYGSSDVAQEVSRIADDTGVPRFAWFPTHYENGPKTANPHGYDPLSCYGRYGIGTVYAENKVYHLYESRTSKNVDIFVNRCNQILDGSFDTSDMLKSHVVL